jgi:hypothetical protein
MIADALNRKLEPEPSGLCGYCNFGGTIANKYRKGRKKGLVNYCPAPIETKKGFTKIHTIIPKDIYLDIDLRDLLYKGMIKMLTNKYKAKRRKNVIAYRFELLFDCPRLARSLIESLSYIYGIGLTNTDLLQNTTSYSAIKFTRNAITDSLINILDPNKDYTRVSFEYTPKLSSIFIPEEGVKYAFIQDYPIIDGYPTYIVPSATITRESSSRPPHSSDLKHITAAQLLSKKEFRLVYYPVKGAEVASYSLGFKGEFDKTVLENELAKRVEAIFDGMLGLPDPMLWCLWCPVWHITNELGESMCPLGKKWIAMYFKERKKEKEKAKEEAKSAFSVELEEVTTEEEPFPYLDIMGRF